MSLTPEQVAAMVADADADERAESRIAPSILRRHVRALAAALESEQHMVAVQTSALEAENEALRRERDEYMAMVHVLASATSADCSVTVKRTACKIC